MDLTPFYWALLASGLFGFIFGWAMASLWIERRQ